MKVPEYYMTLLQELSEGTRKPPEGISLSQQEPLPRAIELQQQIQGMGLPRVPPPLCRAGRNRAGRGRAGGPEAGESARRAGPRPRADADTARGS